MTELPLSGLSQEQRDIVDHPLESPAVVDAGAGTGKTFTIVERVAALHERENCPADKILLLTFARKAAAELRERISRRLNETMPQCSTFHAFAWQILSAHAYDIGLSPETTVIDDVEARVEFRKAFDDFLADPHAPASGFPLRQFNLTELRDELFSIAGNLKDQGVSIAAFRDRALAAADAFARIPYRELRSPYKALYKGQTHKIEASISDEQFAQEIFQEKARVAAAADVFSRFDKRLAERNVLTYADILLRAEAALRASPSLRDELLRRYRHCIVDEYQDTDLAQHRFLEALFGPNLARVMVVGDVLQSIYSFRGARPENVQAFKNAPQSREYPLLENRRSFQEILDLAHHAVLPAHEDAARLLAHRGGANEQIVHVSSLWDDAEVPSREYIPADEVRRLEARMVAQRISRMLASSATVESADGKREALTPRHIAILSRTKMNVQPVTEALLAERIPFRLVGGVGFYDAPEIRDVLAWLRLLADPFNAEAAARALASSAIGASDAMLGKLAQDLSRDETAFSRRSLVEVLDALSDDLGEHAKSAADKLRCLLDDLAPYAALPLIGALRAVLEHTGIEQFYAASGGARAAQAGANLEKLAALARGFAEDTPGAQPADFISFMDELERVDFDEREADVPSSDAVTISTIHAAKGLEWPYVFVLGVWPDVHKHPRLFIDEQGALLYAEGPDASRPFHYLSETKRADGAGIVRGKSDEKAESEAEERRLFYVAITRARDRVFLSGRRYRGSKKNPAGVPHRFLQRVYEWLDQHSWEVDEHLRHHGLEEPRNVPVRVETPREAPRTAPTRSASQEIPVRESALTAPLSYSVIAGFEQCPRQMTYRLMLRVPQVAQARKRRGSRGDVDEMLDASDLGVPDSLLSAGDYGQTLHKALELWALAKQAGAETNSAAELVRDAASVLRLSLPPKQAKTAAGAVEQIMAQMSGWSPLRVEAPFTIDFGDEGRPLLVFGYLDLLATDTQGRPCLVDYKTGDLSSDHSLQLALYRAAAHQVYGVDEPSCFIGKVAGEKFSLEEVAPISDEELRRRIVAVRDGLLARDAHPVAGAWCSSCGYRAAPCQDYDAGAR